MHANILATDLHSNRLLTSPGHLAEKRTEKQAKHNSGHYKDTCSKENKYVALVRKEFGLIRFVTAGARRPLDGEWKSG